MSASRLELLQWVNDLLKTNITKVEQCGTGAIYCQLFDSVHRDVPMSRVKHSGRLEYEYIYNYKILQAGFNNHNIDKIIPIEKLIKCKYQDNLDFLQWMKKYWDTFSDGSDYDAVARRESRVRAISPVTKSRSRTNSEEVSKSIGRPALPKKQNISPKTRSKSSFVDKAESYNSIANTSLLNQYPEDFAGSISQNGRVSGTAVNFKIRSPSVPPNTKRNITSDQWDRCQIQLKELRAEVAMLRKNDDEIMIVAESLEKERNFYFGKLREIEIVVRQKLEKIQMEQSLIPILTSIQGIMYKTEEGFASLKKSPTTPSNIEESIFPTTSMNSPMTAENIQMSFSQNILNTTSEVFDPKFSNLNHNISQPPTTNSNVDQKKYGVESKTDSKSIIAKEYDHSTVKSNFHVRPESAKPGNYVSTASKLDNGSILDRKNSRQNLIQQTPKGSMNNLGSGKHYFEESDSIDNQFCDAEDDKSKNVLSETPPLAFDQASIQNTSEFSRNVSNSRLSDVAIFL